MGKATKANFTEVSGRVGNVIFYQVNGKTYARSRPSKRSKPAVGEEKKNQQGFAVVMKYVRACLSVIKMGFYHVSLNRSPYHTALSVNLISYKNVEKPDTPEWLLFSEGNRAGALNLQLRKDDRNQVILGWGEPEADKPFANDDRAVVVVINNNQFNITPFIQHSVRSEYAAQVDGIKGQPGDILYCYLFFISSSPFSPAKNKQLVSATQYAGSLTL